MSEKRYELRLCPNGTYYVWENGELVIDHISFDKWHKEDANDLIDLLNELAEENEQLRNELQQTKEYLQTKIDECKNHKKMKEIVFGVEQAVGYEKALLQFQKGLKRRLNNE